MEIQYPFGRFRGYCEKSIKKEDHVNELSGTAACATCRVEAV